MSKSEVKQSDKYLNGYKFDELLVPCLDVINSNDTKRILRLYREFRFLEKSSFLNLSENCRHCFKIICETIYNLYGFNKHNKENFIDKSKKEIVFYDNITFNILNSNIEVNNYPTDYNVPPHYFDLHNWYFTEDFPIEYLFLSEEEIIKNVTIIFNESKESQKAEKAEKERLENIRKSALDKMKTLTKDELESLGLDINLDN